MKTILKYCSLLLSLSFICGHLNAQEEQTKPSFYSKLNDQIDEATSQEKIQKTKAKLFKSIRRSMSERKEAKMIRNIAKSKELSNEQKVALFQVLESIKPEIYAFPDNTAQ